MVRQKKYIRFFSWLSILISILIYLKLSNSFLFIQDDAYTVFRYVKNFLDGNGLVFNHGEYVEGYTNFLWVMILSLIGYLGGDYVSLSQYLTIAFGVIDLLLIYIISSKFVFVSSGKPYQKIFAIFPVYLMALNESFIYWSISGMESSLFVMFVLLGLYFYVAHVNKFKYNYLFIIAFVFASLTRPEGILIFSLIIIFKLYTLAKANRFKGNNELRKIKIESSLFLLLIGIFLIFRIIYYGYLLPNTFYAKAGISYYIFSRGVDYLISFVKNPVLLPVITSLILLPALFRKKTKGHIVDLFLFLTFFYGIAIVALGGDVLPLHRFFLPILPLLFIIFSKLLFELTIWINDRFRLNNYSILYLCIVFVLIIGYLNLNIGVKRIQKYRSYELGLIEKMKCYAKWVNDKQIGNENYFKVAVSTIGAFSYYSNSSVIDIIGLTDEYIAHNPVETEGIKGNVNVLWKERNYNANYVLEQNPDYIIFPAGLKPSAYPEAALFSKKEFHKKYYTQIFYSRKMNQMLPIFTRKSEQQIEAINDSLFNKTWNISFVADYIDANKALLVYLRKPGEKIKNKIIFKANKAVSECPWFADKPLATLGTLYFYGGDFKKAIEVFNKSLKINPLNSQAHLYLMYIYYKLKNEKLWQEHLIKLKQVSPDALLNFSLKIH